MSNPSMEQMQPHQSWGPPQPLPPNPVGGPGYGQNPQYMPPPRQLDSYYPADMPPPMEKQPHQGISAYGREPMGGHASSNAQGLYVSSGQDIPSLVAYFDFFDLPPASVMGAPSVCFREIP